MIKKLTNASTKFVKGPAIATNAIPHTPHLSLVVLIGTGFAPPNATPPKKYDINGNNTDINGSRCLIGLSVNLPSFFAVVSPSANATEPCANSCNTIETTITHSTITAPNISFIPPPYNNHMLANSTPPLPKPSEANLDSSPYISFLRVLTLSARSPFHQHSPSKPPPSGQFP